MSKVKVKKPRKPRYTKQPRKGELSGEHCPKCGIECLIKVNASHPQACSRHHVRPKRHFGPGGHKIFLCRRCHSILETWIPRERQPTWFYEFIVKYFMEGLLDDPKFAR